MDIIVNIFKTMIEFAFEITGDWGMAIVLLTITVKLILMPLSIKQKIAMKKQVVLSKEVEIVRNKYKNNKKRQDYEVNKIYSKNAKGMLGCFLPFLQLPIISGLYMSVGRLPVEAMTMLVPWVMNIGTIDNKFIIPLIYTIVSALPSVFSYLKVFDNEESPISIKAVIPMIIFSLIITVKSPIGLGIYLVTSSLFSLVEDIGFKLYSRNKVFA